MSPRLATRQQLVAALALALLAALLTACPEQTASEHRVVNLTTKATPAMAAAVEDGGAAAGAADESPPTEDDPAEEETGAEPAGGIEVKGRGHLSDEQIEAVIAAGAAATQRCFAREVERDAALAGQVVARITIARTGRVQSVRVLSSDFPGKAVTRCLTKNIKRWRFPRPAGGPVAVTCPLRPAAE